MLDIAWMRENQEVLAEGLCRLGAEDAPWQEALSWDAQRRQNLVEVEKLRQLRNEKSKEIGTLFQSGKQEEAHSLRAEVSAANEKLNSLEASLRGIESKLLEAMLQIPNLPEPDVPVSESDEDYVVVKEVGALPQFSFKAKPHWEIGENLDILDLERGVKMSGSRQYVLKKEGARLQRALSSWCLDVLTSEYGFEEVYTPFMVLEESMIGTGNLPKFGDELYRDREEGLWLIPTAEVPVTNLYREEILPPGSLPISHAAHTPCFRKERVHAGRLARGIHRVHQFQKVEMVKIVEPESGPAELENLTLVAESMLERLGLAYRRILIPSGDLSFVAAKKIDLEIWGSGSQEWLEVSSCAWFKDFQARRANIRYRSKAGERPRFPHTLNGSGLALPRIIIGILESFQQEDGSVILPEVVRPYMGGLERIVIPA